MDPHQAEVEAMNDAYDAIFGRPLTTAGRARVLRHLSEMWEESRAYEEKYVGSGTGDGDAF